MSVHFSIYLYICCAGCIIHHQIFTNPKGCLPFTLVIIQIKLHNVLNQEETGGRIEFVWLWLVRDMRIYLQLDILEISLFRVIVCDISPFFSLFSETFINLKDGVTNGNTTIYLLGASLLSRFLLFLGLWKSP